MFKNYLKLAYRNLVKQKYYSLINIFGLAFGIAASVMIFLWINHELSYDKFYDNYKNIHRITCDAAIGGQNFEICVVPTSFANKLKEICPEVLQSTRISPYFDIVFEYNINYYKEKRTILADSNFFRVFSHKFIEGNAEKPFTKKNSIVLTQSTAKKYFGNEKAVGKVLLRDGNDPFVVSAVIEDIPSNSHMHFDVALYLDNENQWNNFNRLTYILLKNNFSETNVNTSMNEIVNNYIITTYTNYFGMSIEQFKNAGNYVHVNIQSLKSIHLNSNFYGELEINGNRTYVIFFTVIAVFILFIASINYMNLSSAYYDTRVVEVGIRKANGATRSKLIRQFLTESLIISIAAFIVGITIMESFLPLFKDFLGINIDQGLSNDWNFMLLLFVLVILLGFISGLYPAMYLSGYKTISVVRNKLYSPLKKSFNTRSALVVFQFTITIIVIVATILVKKQVNFLLNKELGFKKEQLIVIEGANNLENNKDIFKNELKQNPQVLNISYSDTYPGNEYNNITDYGIEGYPPDQQFILKTIYADADYFDTYNMEIIQGRKFSASDNNAIILNEKAVDLMRLDNPLKYYIISNNETIPVLGIVKDFHHDPLNIGLDPMLIRLRSSQYLDFITIRISEGNIKDAMSFITAKWDELSGNKPFEYYFLDNKLQSAYNAEMKAGNVFSIFTVLSVIIACMGILGIASYLIQRRIKEIGIRKANGAKTGEVTLMFLIDFTKWVLIALLIACPVGYYAMDKWLQNFAYRTELSWWVFAVAGAVALMVALLTVSWQSYRAASRNPVESLRYE